MARAVRKKELTAEERLAAALVPEEEQPYKVPGNWCWVRMNAIAQWGSGGTPSRKKPEYYKGTIPWVKTGELNDGYVCETEEHITEEAIAHSSAKLFPANTIAIAMYGATIGKVGILSIDATTNQACACGVCNDAILHKFLFYYARSQKDAFVNKAKGGAQPNISQETIKNHAIPLPPLPEQQRIVTLSESLFADLDEAKEKLTAVVEGFAQRKEAILHQAFTGELTAKWREENRNSLDDWSEVAFDDCVDRMQNGLSKRNGHEGKDYAVLRLANIGSDDIVTDDLRYIMLNDKEQEKYELYNGDVLMIRVNGSRDNVARQIYVSNPKNWAFCDHLIRINYKDNINSRYMCYLAKTQEYRRYIEDNMVSSAGQNTISRKGMQGFRVMLPSLSEQREIVRILDGLFEQEQQAQSAVETVLADIDTLKKSILARAFRGELSTNNPKEENAVEMLKKVLCDLGGET